MSCSRARFDSGGDNLEKGMLSVHGTSGSGLYAIQQVMHMTSFDATTCAVVGKRGYLHIKEEKAEGSERLSDSLQVTQPIAGS